MASQSLFSELEGFLWYAPVSFLHVTPGFLKEGVMLVSMSFRRVPAQSSDAGIPVRRWAGW